MWSNGRWNDKRSSYPSYFFCQDEMETRYAAKGECENNLLNSGTVQLVRATPECYASVSCDDGQELNHTRDG
ncbi:hypothetical protein TeGR_g2038, partial [Tetraparma gracilis]